MRILPALLVALVAVPLHAEAPRRLIVSAPPGDPGPARQRALIAAWREGAAARDLVLVTIAGDGVAGSGETAGVLRRRYRLPRAGFAGVLVGRDGHVALRIARPIDGTALAAAIDAMPMRRAGLR